MKRHAIENLFVLSDDEPRVANVRPKDAAALVLYRRERGIIRILMGERHARHAFLPGRFVFPGGRLEPSDQSLRADTQLRPEILEKVAKGTSASRARGLALAAIRETFEETGLILGRASPDVPATSSPVWRRFFSHSVVPHLETLDFIARAITPPGRPRRFDARFFMAGEEEIAGRLDVSQASGELKDLGWLTLTEARAAHIIPITRCIIDEIEARLGDGADGRRPVPFFIPHRGKAIVKEL